jgi:predicted nucleic acid-binding protein
MRLEWIPPSNATIGRAIEIARTYETTVYDAAFVSLAESLNATFVTADAGLVRRLSGLPRVHSLKEL